MRESLRPGTRFWPFGQATIVRMDLMHFHKLRTAIQGNAAPASLQDLATLEGTLRDLLMASGLFVEVEVERTDDPDRFVIAMCEFNPDLSDDDVARLLERMWQDKLRYPYWEAHAFKVENGHVEFQAASRHSNGGHYVTVHLVAQKATIPKQRGPRGPEFYQADAASGPSEPETRSLLGIRRS